MSDLTTPQSSVDNESAHLEALGYTGTDFHRSMSLWSNLALGFTYLSPLVGVYSLFAYSLSLGGPPSLWWIIIVGCGQFLVALIFGEVVSQYPIAGGIYPWTRRLWGRRYAWMVSWVYVWAVIVTVTAVAEFGGSFVASLFGMTFSKEVGLATAVALLLLALAFNFTGTRTLARVAQIGLGAELIGVIALGLYLLIFKRVNSFSVFFDSMGAGGSQSYFLTFLGAALSGLFLFYGFEACGDVAEEVDNPTRRIPRAMMLTILVGGVSSLMSYVGYVLAAPNLQDIVSGNDPDPIPSILESSLGHIGAKLFLCIAITAFVSCVLSLQAAGSRLIFAFARDKMLPGSTWLSKMSERHAVPANALLVACVIPIVICVYVYAFPDQLPRITAFAVLGIYIAFQAVVLAALRQRLRGWRPAGDWNLGRWGMIINIAALGYGVVAMILLLKPVDGGTFLDKWIVAIGLVAVVGVGLIYMLLARPYQHSDDVGEGDAIEVAEKLRMMRSNTTRHSA
ncbi:APC family permease [Mycobacterium sp. URHB0044]|uniref:APC family permease n=1 Tax=Mycobacterium sp. URHB0044 TaxID=1380386 RepID=UPI00048B3890|nr:amino acid permease [Mycobacterium sp. URHB0044]